MKHPVSRIIVWIYPPSSTPFTALLTLVFADGGRMQAPLTGRPRWFESMLSSLAGQSSSLASLEGSQVERRTSIVFEVRKDRPDAPFAISVPELDTTRTYLVQPLWAVSACLEVLEYVGRAHSHMAEYLPTVFDSRTTTT